MAVLEKIRPSKKTESRLEKREPAKEKERFDPHQISIATATRYGRWQPLAEGQKRDIKDIDGIRGDLALQTLKTARENGFQATVVDSPASSSAFKKALAEIDGIHVHQEADESTMSGGRRQALTEASKLAGAKVLFWTEPEKADMINHVKTITAPIRNNEADIVVPKRNETLFAETYPSFQQEYEQRANKRFNNLLARAGLLPRDETTGLLAQDAEALDVWIGPRAIKNEPDVLKHFMQVNTFDKPAEEDTIYHAVDPEKWPDALFLPIVSALKEGLRVKSVNVNYRHPAEQTASEVNNPAMNAKRQEQYGNIIFSTIHALKENVFDQSDENPHAAQRSRLRKVA